MSAFRGRKTRVVVEGTINVILEISEQLCWLVSALSKPEASLCAVEPSIEVVDSPFQVMHFRIQVQHSRLQAREDLGNCWSGLFDRCAIVKNFPIPKRPHPGLGLEMLLEVASELVGTDSLHEFGNSVYLKGYSSIATPVLRIQNILIWRTKHEKGQDRISYNTFEDPEDREFTEQDLVGVRYIFGWCQNVRNRCGKAGYAHCTEFADISAVPMSHALRHCFLHFGKPISRRQTYLLNMRQEPANTRRDSLMDVLAEMKRRFFLLWDTAFQRGWLVNGVDMLSHVIRASIGNDSREYGNTLFELREGDLKEPKDVFGHAASRDFLSDLDNLTAKLAVTDVIDGVHKYETLRDRLRIYYDVLEKCIDYQRLKSWETTPRSQLGGWDFVSLVHKEDPIYPQYTRIPVTGHTWIDFMRATGVVTLFGHDLGDLLTPVSEECLTLPEETFGIAVTLRDFRQILQSNKCRMSWPMVISKSPCLKWYISNSSSSQCPCASGAKSRGKSKERSFNEVAQTIGPSEHAHLLPPTWTDAGICLHEEGAIVFGHNDMLQYHIPDFGSPAPGRGLDLVEVEENKDNEDDDSNNQGLSSREDEVCDREHFESDRQHQAYDRIRASDRSCNVFGNINYYSQQPRSMHADYMLSWTR